MAYVLQKHLLSQNLQNLLMAHFTNASCTTRTMSYTTCFLNLYITLDKDITIGKASSLVSCTIGILFTVCCLRTAINNVFTYVLLFVLFLRVFVQMRSVILSNKWIWMLCLCSVNSHLKMPLSNVTVSIQRDLALSISFGNAGSPVVGYCCLVKDGVSWRLQQHGKLVREKKRTLKQVKKSIADLMQKNAEMLKELEALNVAVNERRHIHNISGLSLSLSLSLISATSSVCRSVWNTRTSYFLRWNCVYTEN